MKLWIVQQEARGYWVLVACLRSIHSFQCDAMPCMHAALKQQLEGDCDEGGYRVCDWNSIRPHTPLGENLNCHIHRSKLQKPCQLWLFVQICRHCPSGQLGHNTYVANTVTRHTALQSQSKWKMNGKSCHRNRIAFSVLSEFLTLHSLMSPWRLSCVIGNLSYVTGSFVNLSYYSYNIFPPMHDDCLWLIFLVGGSSGRIL